MSFKNDIKYLNPPYLDMVKLFGYIYYRTICWKSWTSGDVWSSAAI